LSETIGRELTSVVDDELGLAKVGKLFFGRTDEHVMLPIFVREMHRRCNIKKYTIKRAW